jgi:hypothetical protein
MISQEMMGFALNIFFNIGLSQGFWKSCRTFPLIRGETEDVSEGISSLHFSVARAYE